MKGLFAPQRPVFIADDEPLPPSHMAMGTDTDMPGLLAVGGRVTPERLEEAYSRGVFPWFSRGQPVLWWSPDPRMVLATRDFKVSRSLRKTLRAFTLDARCEIRVDHQFERVINACGSTPRDGQRGTWIGPEILGAYTAWHHQGKAHSVETWIDGELVGGLYGVNLGRMFFGESMFAWQTDASKIALSALVVLCRHHGIEHIDCQQNTGHLASLGAKEMPKEHFEAIVTHAVKQPSPAQWTYDPAWWQHLALHGPQAGVEDVANAPDPSP
jgi:leucyl/phenylalanyl-tRNA---protein transferase